MCQISDLERHFILIPRFHHRVDTVRQRTIHHPVGVLDRGKVRGSPTGASLLGELATYFLGSVLASFSAPFVLISPKASLALNG